MLRVGIPRETAPGETRVALVPEGVARLVQAGFEVAFQAGAGERASFPDSAYADVGAQRHADARALYAASDVVVKIHEPRQDADLGAHEADLLREGSVLISFLSPARHADAVALLTARRVTAFSMDLVPRISRAQKMDALSSMSTVAGYRAALIAAESLGKFFPLLITAAGTIAPARAFVLGAGVAGLQAIATCRRLGAVVEAFDVRPAVREEVQSLGATFVAAELVDSALVGEGGYAKALSADQELQERELIHRHVSAADVVITTANVPGRRAPLLVTEAMVKEMRAGSVIVDLAAETGGNCELTRPNTVVTAHGVLIHGPVNLAASLPVHASQMYSRNVLALLTHLTRDGRLHLDWEDEITRASCVTRDSSVVAALPATPKAPAEPALAARPEH